MFISRKRFEELENRIKHMEIRMDRFQDDLYEMDRLHRGLEQRVSEAEGKVRVCDSRLEALEAKAAVLDEYAEMDEADRKAEWSFLQGIQNIMNFRG